MIHYLTVQDILWINHEVARRVNDYKFAQLEEATFYQYGYGKSEDVLKQAAGFLTGFIKLRPFSSGNVGTAFISVLAFLKINGYNLALDPGNAVGLVQDVAAKKISGAAAISEIVDAERNPVDLKPAIRTEVHDIMERYNHALEKLVD
jgi:prophage maintenance system killer protein